MEEGRSIDPLDNIEEGLKTIKTTISEILWSGSGDITADISLVRQMSRLKTVDQLIARQVEQYIRIVTSTETKKSLIDHFQRLANAILNKLTLPATSKGKCLQYVLFVSGF